MTMLTNIKHALVAEKWIISGKIKTYLLSKDKQGSRTRLLSKNKQNLLSKNKQGLGLTKIKPGCCERRCS